MSFLKLVTIALLLVLVPVVAVGWFNCWLLDRFLVAQRWAHGNVGNRLSAMTELAGVDAVGEDAREMMPIGVSSEALQKIERDLQNACVRMEELRDSRRQQIDHIQRSVRQTRTNLQTSDRTNDRSQHWTIDLPTGTAHV